MMSEEITTGSARSGDQEKRILAERSHAWNIQQKRFRDAFPEVRDSRTAYESLPMTLLQYSQPEMKDLPNMGVKERGIPPTAEGHVDSRSSSPDSSTSSVQGGDGPTTQPTSAIPGAIAGATGRTSRRGHAPARNVKRQDGWTSTIGRFVTEKWQFGLLVVVAVLVMRLSA